MIDYVTERTTKNRCTVLLCFKLTKGVSTRPIDITFTNIFIQSKIKLLLKMFK